MQFELTRVSLAIFPMELHPDPDAVVGQTYRRDPDFLCDRFAQAFPPCPLSNDKGCEVGNLVPVSLRRPHVAASCP